MGPLTLGYLPFFGLSQVEVIEAAASAGFGSVGLRIEERRRGERFAHSIVRDTHRLQEITGRLKDLGVVLSNVIGRSLEPDTTDEELCRLVDAAFLLGSRQILVNGHDPDERRLVENLTRLAAHAREAKMRVGVEFVPFHSVRDLPQAVRIVTDTGLDNVGVVVDSLHLSRSGGCPDDIMRIPANLICWGQLSDAPAEIPPSLEGRMQESRGGRLLPGEGGLPLLAFIKTLPGDCEIEVEVASAADEGLTADQRAKTIRTALDGFLATHRGSGSATLPL